MDTMDNAALQEVVGAFKEEVKRNRLHEKKLQRENRALLRSLLRLQQQQQRERQTCNLQDVPLLPGHDGILQIHKGEEEEEEEEEYSQEGDDISGSSPSWPSSTTTVKAELSVSTSSPRQETTLPTKPNGGVETGVLSDISPTRHNAGNFCEESKEALQARVKLLEKQLLRERLRRKAQAADFTAELEILRVALDEAEKRAARPPPWRGDNAAEFGNDPPLLLRSHDGTSDSNLEYHETPNNELVTHSRTSTAVSMENAEQAVGVEGLDVPRKAALCDMGGCVEEEEGDAAAAAAAAAAASAAASAAESPITGLYSRGSCHVD
ncbi:phosphatidylinositol-4-phosphate 5-kinase-like, putative [Trypanosoma cruzi marinkellei]|uniref:Phosphatidylinositol-4-phosphate 5-kinase-like, putative n=1 Tax=Trypanosoma cruzi marinkellei TaxID=85056 RepID=K2NBP9_TRYCR|nr:phosphatidylinositol-4-phosphate 5-kinase-like, putative [Trypanosoma cruzi marinkellei]